MDIRRSPALCVLALVALVGLAGCSNTMERAENTATERLQNADRLFRDARQPPTRQTASPIRFSNEIYLGHRSFRSRNGDPLPPRFDFITLASAERLTLHEIASEITALTGIAVIVERPLPDLGPEAAAASDAVAEGSPGASEAVAGAIDATLIGAAGGGGGPAAGGMLINHSGPLRQLLDLVSARFGYSWEFRDNTVFLLGYVTRTFALEALPSTATIRSELEAATQTQGGGDDVTTAGAIQGTEVEATIELWEDIRETVVSMIPEGSRVALSRANGTLTVSTTPWAMRKVEEYVREQNALFRRQVAISVQVLSVQSNRDDAFNFDLDALFENFDNEFTLGFAGPVQTLGTLEGLGNVSAGVIRPADGVFDNPIDRFGGSELVVQALSRNNRLSLLNTAAVTTLNNQAAPVQVVQRQSYVESSETTLTDGGAQTSLETSTLTTGFVLNMLPRILGSGEILLQYALSLSELEGIRTAGTDTVQVELPTVRSRDFLQQVRIRSGDTLVLAGFQSAEDRSERTGTGTPNNFLFGGGRNAREGRETIVILINPVLLR